MKVRWMRVCALLAAGLVAVVASGCGGGESEPDDGAATAVDPGEKVELVWWAWDPSAENSAKLYEQEHPNVTVKVVNAGVDADEYTKFRAAAKAGKANPDVVMLDFAQVGSFIAEELIVDLTEYGADEVRDDFAPWYMDLVSQGMDGLYGLPLDAGLMAFFYRADLFKEYGLEAPATWKEYAETARAVREADPKAYLTDFPISYDWLEPLMYQRGWRPFDVEGENITIRIDSPEALEVAAYWDDLIAADAVKPGALFASSWFSGIEKGRYASILGAQWLPVLIEKTSDTFGKWRAAPMPQWSEGENVTPLFGGSVYAVSTKSDHPEVAADLVKFVTSDPEVVQSNNAEVPYAFYPLKSLYESDEWQATDLPFYGPQKANEVFAQAAENVTADIEFSPFESYVSEQGDKLFGQALKDGTPLVDALRKLQPIVVDYAEQQGFTVTE